MSYFQHQYASNSDLKEIVCRHEGRTKPDLKEIFDFGSAFHAGILEPHKADYTNVSKEDQELIKQMSKTFWKKEICRNLVMMPDFRREHEFYRTNRFGIGARCKTDGDSKKCRTILELKGLSVSSEKQFKESVQYLDYDQGATWYLNVGSSYAMKYEHKLIAGISKYDPELMFLLLVGWHHPYYKQGMEKVRKAVSIWRMYGLK